MFLPLVGKDLFEQLYPIKHFTHQQEQGKDSNHNSGHSEEKYSQHLPICSTISATAAPSLAMSSSTVVCRMVTIVSILFPQIHDDIVFYRFGTTLAKSARLLNLLQKTSTRSSLVM